MLNAEVEVYDEYILRLSEALFCASFYFFFELSRTDNRYVNRNNQQMAFRPTMIFNRNLQYLKKIKIIAFRKKEREHHEKVAEKMNK